MAIRIEILDVVDKKVHYAFYFPVPAGQEFAQAADPSRIPVGNALSAQEIQDLKDGKLIEETGNITFSAGTKKSQAASALESSWAERLPAALKDYTNTYRFGWVMGATWDDTDTWIVP